MTSSIGFNPIVGGVEVQVDGAVVATFKTAGNGMAIPAATASGDAVRKDQLDGGATNSASGFLGERKESVVGATNSPASGVYGDLTSISFGVGTWDISCTVVMAGNTATSITNGQCGLGTDSGTASTGLALGDTLVQFAGNGAFSSGGSVVGKRYVFASPTTIYLKMSSGYSTGVTQFYGRLSGTRVAL